MRRALCIALLSIGGSALAYPGAPAGAISEESRLDAKKRFARALKLFDEGDSNGALAELTRAWELTGNYVVLYNIGLVQLTLGRYVLAEAALTEVIDAKPDPLKPDQRKRAIEARDKARARIGSVRVVPKLPDGAAESSLNNAVVELDGVEVARWPLAAPLRVGVGKHAIGLIATGHAPLRREVTVAGETSVDLEMPLVPMLGSVGRLQVLVSVPASTVTLDGVMIGLSPIDKGLAVTPGNHVVEAKRPGYVTASSAVNVGADSVAHANLQLTEDPAAIKAINATVTIVANEPPGSIEIDGIGRAGDRIALPPGPHSLRVEKKGFVPTLRTFELEAGANKTLNVSILPTPETLAAHDASVSFHRTWGIVGITSGVVLTTVGAILYIPGRTAYADARARQAEQNASTDPGGDCHISKPPASFCAERAQQINDDLSSSLLRRNVGAGLLIGGGVALGTGIVLLLTGPSGSRFDKVRPEIGLNYFGATFVF
jgi:hypothetical protein